MVSKQNSNWTDPYIRLSNQIELVKIPGEVGKMIFVQTENKNKTVAYVVCTL
jgi:hypothetical protein